jgi:hypothetical protein
VCAYSESGGCSATGVCVPETPGGGACPVAPQVCGCNGMTTYLDGSWCAITPGYALMPIAHTGPCP